MAQPPIRQDIQRRGAGRSDRQKGHMGNQGPYPFLSFPAQQKNRADDQASRQAHEGVAGLSPGKLARTLVLVFGNATTALRQCRWSLFASKFSQEYCDLIRIHLKIKASEERPSSFLEGLGCVESPKGPHS